MSKNVVVIGAGIVGVSSALALQSRGYSVRLMDRKEPGNETSFGNAGLISRTAVMPFNNPGLWKKMPHYLTNRHVSVRYRWSYLIKNFEWLARFLAETRKSRLEPRVSAIDSLMQHSARLHGGFMDAAGIRHRLRENGTLKLWRNPETGPAAAAADYASGKKRGFKFEILNRQDISRLEPDINPIFSAGILSLDNASVDWPQAVVQAYASLFAARGGVFLQDAAKSITRNGDGWTVATEAKTLSADLVVIALGPWSKDLLSPLGIKVPLGVERGYHRHYHAPGRKLSRPFYDVESSFFLSPMEGGFRLTSGVELADRDATSDFYQIDAVLPLARQAFDLGEQTSAGTWRGARPTLPDCLPIIGQAPRHPGLWLAFGNQHNGFSTGPSTGELLATLINRERPLVDPYPFRPDRYI